MEPDWLTHEQSAWSAGCQCVAGIDEAGRGALAGPVVAACVVLPRGTVPIGVNDSKKLTPFQRETCYKIIFESGACVGVGMAQPHEIDEINILRATHLAMRAALADLSSPVTPDMVLIDGLPVKLFPVAHLAIVGGDALCASIAAASIVAKVTRDRLMCELDVQFPAYLFAQHKGYGTARHLAAIADHGPCVAHRRTFQPIAALLGGNDRPVQGSLPLGIGNCTRE